MLHKFFCECGQKISVDVQRSVGRKGKCPRCGSVFEIEASPDEPEAPPTPSTGDTATAMPVAGGRGAGLALALGGFGLLVGIGAVVVLVSLLGDDPAPAPETDPEPAPETAAAPPVDDPAAAPDPEPEPEPVPEPDPEPPAALDIERDLAVVAEGLDRSTPGVRAALAKYEQMVVAIDTRPAGGHLAHHADEVEGLLATIPDDDARSRLAARFADLRAAAGRGRRR